MFKKTLKLEQLERKDLFAAVVDADPAMGATAATTLDQVGQPVVIESTSHHVLVRPVGETPHASPETGQDDPVVVDVEPDGIAVDTAIPGDANLDGKFNQLDIVHLLQQDKYMKKEPATWCQGDFNRDGFFSQSDLVLALQVGVFGEEGYRAFGSNTYIHFFDSND